MKTPLRHLPAIVAFLALGTLSATADAQSGPLDPHVVTCSQMLAAAGAPDGSHERIAANLLTYWMIGYFYGRFDGVPEANATAERFAANVGDVVNAVRQICPNVPDMPMAEFARNLANDLQTSIDAN